ncbi:MAG: hypothetical protein MAG794_01839 [Gammaproteobacteria bacterium]|nr:hypothetical protein [Gammaproteobacteria bacterium]
MSYKDLARHELAVESAHAVKTGLSIGDQLLSASVDHSTELLVAGAYGYPRVRNCAKGDLWAYPKNRPSRAWNPLNDKKTTCFVW